MVRRKTHVPLNVFLNSRHVGVLRRETSGAIDFTYARDWLDWSETFPVSLSLPLRESRYIGAPVTNVFDNLLPDSELIRRRVAERVGAEGIDPYSLLTALGHDCVGALQFLPDGSEPGTAGSVEGRAVSDDEIAALLANLASAPLGVGDDEDFRISIAGAQEKTALLRKDGKWFKPSGTAATTHILKPQIGQIADGVDLSNSVENEYLCLKLAAALGLPSADAEIADFGDRRTLIVERFDRRWTGNGRLLRLPQEDMCQALSIPPTRKYQSEGGPGMRAIIQLLKASDRPDEDTAAFMRACILFWLIGATDGHAKNFSIFLAPGGRFHMTPLYDVLTTQPSLDSGQIARRKFKLAMSVGKNNHYALDEIVPRHFQQTADEAGIGTAALRAIFEEFAATTGKAMQSTIDELPKGFPSQLVDSIAAPLKDRTRMIEQFLEGGTGDKKS
ncbi:MULTISPECIES: type II toxin-antitoxin system HipA family toxin [Mesorhizobium]|uniref:Type II toxin-antitoxin system HipA family toxin n=1 Tax=Mesorhizobium denitrificans TaxID=2294114 RepID=A0A371X3U8_9HYPH|nr:MULTISPECIES: type II toxin-antitoxin system HipA family toxin [Mesorhizobium]RFC63901.1 type II toxin-antitoxin system HipA family toxin [Mesorhizobium denitrificans]